MVGDELLLGRVVDRNTASLAAALARVGVRVTCSMIVGDSVGALSSVLASHGTGFDLIVVAGGLGPTEDDRTRQEFASAASSGRLVFSEIEWRRIVEYLHARGVEVSDRNRRQAFFPAGAVPIVNRHGTAPAFRIRLQGGADCWALPGIPAELDRLMAEEVLPTLRAELGISTTAEQGLDLHFFGIPEGTLDEWFVDSLPKESLHSYHICVHEGEIEVRLPPGIDLREACAGRFGSAYLGAGGEYLAERVVAEARSNGIRIATAESCTGGLLASRITRVPGASAIFPGGWVTYSEALKASCLGVPEETIRRFGAVSAEVALEMAGRARSLARAELGVSITGVAGPDGGTVATPVGAVFVGLADPSSAAVRRFRLHGDRGMVRARAVAQSLYAVLCALRGATPEEWAAEATP